MWGRSIAPSVVEGVAEIFETEQVKDGLGRVGARSLNVYASMIRPLQVHGLYSPSRAQGLHHTSDRE